MLAAGAELLLWRAGAHPLLPPPPAYFSAEAPAALVASIGDDLGYPVTGSQLDELSAADPRAECHTLEALDRKVGRALSLVSRSIEEGLGRQEGDSEAAVAWKRQGVVAIALLRGYPRLKENFPPAPLNPAAGGD